MIGYLCFLTIRTFCADIAIICTPGYPLMTSELLDTTVRRIIRSADTAVHFLFQGGEPTLMGMPPENCAMVGRCGPSLVIESDGSVYPCDFYALDEWKLGSIAEDSLKRMLASDKEKAFLAESLVRCAYGFL